MTRYTNNAGVDISAAIWLAYDDYDYVDEKNYISVTTLIKPVRQIILGQRLPKNSDPPDVIDVFRSRLGQAFHKAVEDAWKLNYRQSMEALGYPKKAIEAVRINPEKEEPGTISVYTEVRAKKEIDGYTVGGKLDLVIEARLRDVKMTSVWGYMNQKSVGNWGLQGSLYRWLNPEKILHDDLVIQYLLTDWSRAGRKRDPVNYPAHPAPSRSLELMGVQETEQWVRNKLRLLQQYIEAPEDQIPDCPDEDLWRDDPVWKYYANPEVAERGGRATKNFSCPSEAAKFKAEKGSKGVIKEFPGLVKACNYCAASSICSQYNRLLVQGQIAEQ